MAKRVLAMLLVLMFCLSSISVSAFAAMYKMCALNLISTRDENRQYELEGTSIRFWSSAEDGAVVYRPVTLTVPESCKVLMNNTSLFGSSAGSDKIYTISEPGSYTLQIRGPASGDDLFYGNISFTIWNSIETTTGSSSQIGMGLLESSVSGSGASPSFMGVGLGSYDGGTSSLGVSSVLAATEYGAYYATDGHMVVPVTLSETYFSEYYTYEQKFRERFFYSNVANGKITGDQVYFDVPAGITVRMTRDGVAVEFLNKTYIKEYGSYLLTLSYTERQAESDLPVEYTASFRFRIQQPLEPRPAGQAAPPQGTITPIPQPGQTETPAESKQEDDGSLAVMGPDAEPKQDLVAMEGVGVYTNLLQSYSEEQGMYLQTAPDASQFYTSIPNGSVVSDPVYFTVPAGMQLTVLKDDEDYPYQEGQPFSEPGVYYIKQEATQSLFTFRLITQPVNSLDRYYAPYGFTVESIKRDGETIAAGQAFAELVEDGSYEIIFAQEDRSITLLVTKDTVAPVFDLDGVENGVAKGGTVTILFAEGEVTGLEVLKNGQNVRYTGSIKEPGSYEVVAYDQAGNAAVQTFTLEYRINVAGVLSIMLLILLAAAGVVLFLRFRKDVKVQ